MVEQNRPEQDKTSQHGSKHFSTRRLRALCLKETRQILRDPSSGLIAFVIPLLLLFIFGYGINLDSSRLHVGILMEQQSEDARDLANTFAASPFIEPTISNNRQYLIQQMQAGSIRGLIVIPTDFAERLARRAIVHRSRLSPTAANPTRRILCRDTRKASGCFGNSSGRKIAARRSSSLSRCNRATGLIPPPSVSISSFPAR